ncbi:hypothetical protein CCACVL1_12678 [Corchorus capsularis]|uniref:Uncharacterized protein n=1 Tax=Corchorus capsularis TaxID=210143 RepID=A0A1R3IEK8_COCAP|nr:hypothetical protein CCACVL1_12678 [Corchorus capsularis]
MEDDTVVPIKFIRDLDDKKSKAKREGMVRRKLTESHHGDINKLADIFISKFRTQLSYQRDEQIKYYPEMKA